MKPATRPEGKHKTFAEVAMISPSEETESDLQHRIVVDTAGAGFESGLAELWPKKTRDYALEFLNIHQ